MAESYLYPTADTTRLFMARADGGITNLFAQVDDPAATPDDADYIRCASGYYSGGITFETGGSPNRHGVMRVVARVFNAAALVGNSRYINAGIAFADTGLSHYTIWSEEVFAALPADQWATLVSEPISQLNDGLGGTAPLSSQSFAAANLELGISGGFFEHPSTPPAFTGWAASQFHIVLDPPIVGAQRKLKVPHTPYRPRWRG